MDLENVRKSLAKQGGFLSKQSAFLSKRVMFLALAGLVVAAGIALRATHYFGQPQGEVTVPVGGDAETPAASPQAASQEAAPATSSVKTDLPPEPATAALPPPQAASPQAASPPVASPQAASPPSPSEQAAGSPSSAPNADEAQQGTETSGPILISKRPVQVLAGPSSTSPALYGFPSGRPFRLIGHQGNFAQIKDLRSGASGWIDETALAELPPAASRSSGSSPSLSSSPSQSRSVASSQAQGAPKSRAASKGGQIGADQQTDSETDALPQRRPGILGGILGGIFGGGN